ncbi:hypothetical protein J1605_020423 [Eschrichtius robustus]|uniref:Synaptogyrin-1 n=1 Tax=Eschrichtius robustus TaxID=9764 RepID=A0AB34HJ17_ESCRO|nr:hypothetical protein J1605_020423 [Eschrichtius robustus]
MKADFPVPMEAGCQGGSGPEHQRTHGPWPFAPCLSPIDPFGFLVNLVPCQQADQKEGGGEGHGLGRGRTPVFSALVCLSPNHPLPPVLVPADPRPQAGQAVLAFQRYQIGADSALFSQDYMDPSQDSSMPYAPYVEPSTGPDPAGMGGTYQQPASAFEPEPQGYQSQGY